jgi:hypothetical protein
MLASADALAPADGVESMLVRSISGGPLMLVE